MQHLFEQYTQAFDRFDAEAISDLYRLPCAITDGDGVQVYSDKEQLQAKFAANCEAMKGFAYKNAEFSILEELHMEADKVAVTVAWRINTNSNHIDFRSLYICHQVNGEWRIFSANVYPGSFEATDSLL